MTLELSQVQRLKKRPEASLWVCNLPERARASVGFSTGAVYLSGQSLVHILEKHTDIDEYEILLLPIAIERGRIFLDGSDKKVICSIFTHENSRTYFIPMKCVAEGHEIYIKSMHRLTHRQFNQKIKALIEI